MNDAQPTVAQKKPVVIPFGRPTLRQALETAARSAMRALAALEDGQPELARVLVRTSADALEAARELLPPSGPALSDPR